MSMCFGKPTGVIFPAAGALALLIAEPELIPTRHRRRIRLALRSGRLRSMSTLALLLFGSIPGYFYWSVEIPYIGNRFYGHMDWTKLLIVLRNPIYAFWRSARLIIGAVPWLEAVAGRALVLVALRRSCATGSGLCPGAPAIPIRQFPLSRRCICSGWCWRRTCGSWGARSAVSVSWPRSWWHSSVSTRWQFDTSPYKWSGNPAEWDKPRNSFSDPEKEAGAFIKAHTKPDDTVFAYTNSPRGDNGHIVLYYAQRRTASPFLYEPWLDPLDLLPNVERKPSAKELAALTAMQTRNRRTACDSVLRNHPAAIAYANLDRIANAARRFASMLQRDFEEAKVIADLRTSPSQAGELSPP